MLFSKKPNDTEHTLQSVSVHLHIGIVSRQPVSYNRRVLFDTFTERLCLLTVYLSPCGFSARLAEGKLVGAEG